jgi:hypothetical protein
MPYDEHDYRQYEEHEEREAEALRLRERQEEYNAEYNADPVRAAVAGWLRSQSQRAA